MKHPGTNDYFSWFTPLHITTGGKGSSSPYPLIRFLVSQPDKNRKEKTKFRRLGRLFLDFWKSTKNSALYHRKALIFVNMPTEKSLIIQRGKKERRWCDLSKSQEEATRRVALSSAFSQSPKAAASGQCKEGAFPHDKGSLVLFPFLWPFLG